jgi:hypothetical protein
MTVNHQTTSKEDFSFPRYSPAVSANIVNRKLWLSISEKPLLEVGWCHIERMLDIIASPRFIKSLFISNRCFTLHRDADGWWTRSNSYEFLFKHIFIIRTMEKRGYSHSLTEMLDSKLSKYACNCIGRSLEKTIIDGISILS